jgi:hypothetical protein
LDGMGRGGLERIRIKKSIFRNFTGIKQSHGGL